MADEITINKKHHQHGFTLIEVLVVLVIVAIITGVAVMAFGNFGRTRTEKIRVETFVRMIAVAQSQAIFTPAVIGLNISPEGYQFFQWQKNRKHAAWQVLKESILYQPEAFSGLLKADVKKIAHYDPVQNQHADKPLILFLPGGYVTPFTVQLVGKDHHFLVSVSNNGNVSMKMTTK